MSSMSESRWWCLLLYFTKKWRAETQQHSSGFANFKPRFESGIFKCISWLNGSFFEGDDRGFLREGVNIYQMAPMSPHDSPSFFCLRIFNLWVSVTSPFKKNVRQLFFSVLNCRYGWACTGAVECLPICWLCEGNSGWLSSSSRTPTSNCTRSWRPTSSRRCRSCCSALPSTTLG